METLKALERILAEQGSDGSVEAGLRSLAVHSVSVGILRHGEIYAKVFSTAGINEETIFQACSISKPVTALATMILAQLGKISLIVPISTYLSPSDLAIIETPKTKDFLKYVTIEHLLSHTSGLSQGGFGGYVINPPSARTILSGHYPSNTPQVRLDGFPGWKHKYSGGGFTVLQVILENVMELPFPELMEQLVLRPLGMLRSFYGTLPSTERNYAKAYLTGDTPAHADLHILPELAAAGLWTTPSDLLKCIKIIEESLHGDAFLEQKWAALMLTEIKEMARGWRVDGNVFHHTGSNDPGYRSIVAGFADSGEISADKHNIDADCRDCGYSIMTNSCLGSDLYTKILMAICFMEKWPIIPKILGGNKCTPFTTSEESVVPDWNKWKRTWEDWKILDASGPAIQFQDQKPVRLLKALIPAKQYAQGCSIDCVVDGFDIMVRMGWNESHRNIELWHGGESAFIS